MLKKLQGADMPDPISIARIPPAKWLRPALSIAGLSRMVEGRSRALECARDGRAPFLNARLRQLELVHTALDGGKFGAASGWVERLELEHVQAYLGCDDAWDRREPTGAAAPWQGVFRGIGERATADAVFDAASIVHLMYDLPLALARVGFGVSFGKTALAYDALTAIYADAPCPSVGRRLGEPVDLSRWQRVLREQAWDDARALSTRDERERKVTFTRIEVAALCEVRRILAEG